MIQWFSVSDKTVFAANNAIFYCFNAKTTTQPTFALLNRLRKVVLYNAFSINRRYASGTPKLIEDHDVFGTKATTSDINHVAWDIPEEALLPPLVSPLLRQTSSRGTRRLARLQQRHKGKYRLVPQASEKYVDVLPHHETDKYNWAIATVEATAEPLVTAPTALRNINVLRTHEESADAIAQSCRHFTRHSDASVFQNEAAFNAAKRSEKRNAPDEPFDYSAEDQSSPQASLATDKTIKKLNCSPSCASNCDEKKDVSSFEEKKTRSKTENTPMTPAQLFFAENRDRLIERAQQYFSDKKAHFEDLPQETNEDVRFDTFYYDPVVRPARGHVWDFGDGHHEIPREEVHLEQGRMPTMEQILKILEQEHITDVSVIDLETCGRRDLGLFFIVATGQTGAHCARTGKLLAKLIRCLAIPYVSQVAYCWGAPSDCWIVSHLGPLQVHILTQEMRERFRIESALINPHEHYTPDVFAGYFDGTSSSPPPFVVEYLKMKQKADEQTENPVMVSTELLES